MNNSIKIRKAIAISSIVCVSVSALIGIMLLFNILQFSSILGNILLTMLTIFVASIVILGTVDSIENKNIFGYVSFALLVLSAIAFIIEIWLSDIFGSFNTYFLDGVVILACFSVFFSAFLNKVTLLGKQLIAIQIIGYVTLGLILAYVIALVCFPSSIGDFLIESIIYIIAIAIICIVMFIVMSVKGKINKAEREHNEKILITLQEYNELKNKISELEKQVKELSK